LFTNYVQSGWGKGVFSCRGIARRVWAPLLIILSRALAAVQNFEREGAQTLLATPLFSCIRDRGVSRIGGGSWPFLISFRIMTFHKIDGFDPRGPEGRILEGQPLDGKFSSICYSFWKKYLTSQFRVDTKI